ncbi:MAG: glycosyltransferase family 4 protein [Ilumatobacteraceae bacterium]
MSPTTNPGLVMGLYFSPRGGSAQVTRYLCRALEPGRWAPTLFAGSMGNSADTANARRFFRGIRCEALDYSPARSAWDRGADPMAATVPMHASFEAKDGVPDRRFCELDDVAFDRQVASWRRFFASRPGAVPSIVHLHHLTPMHEAVRLLWPGVPVVTHLHGTELKMLASLDGLPGEATDEPKGRWAGHWVERMRHWAAASDRVVVVSAQDGCLARQLLPVESARISTIGNGVDTHVFTPRPVAASERLARWRHWLVDDPRGWCPGGRQGSISYRASDLTAFTDHNGQPVPVVLFAGRFMRFKRLQLMIEAHHALRSTSTRRSVLVIAGGFPGEWEGEHPYDTVRRLGAEGVFFVGWRDHDDLADILRCSDVFAAPAVDEPFGLVYLEAMAAGLAPIATATGGPATFVNTDSGRPTGWLVPPDDLAATSRALGEAVSDGSERLIRGGRAARFVRDHYSWEATAAAFTALYDDVIGDVSDVRRDQASGEANDNMVPVPSSGRRCRTN